MFKPYAGVKTAVIFYTKGGKTERVWFYEVTGDGLTLDDKRQADPENDNLKDLPAAYEKQAEGPCSWIVSREQIVAEEYNLTASRYKPVVADQTKHKDPKKIITEVLAIENEIAEGLERLEKQI